MDVFSYVKFLEVFGTPSFILVYSFVIIEWSILVLVNFVKSKKEGLVTFISFIIMNIPYLIFSRLFVIMLMLWFYEHSLFDLGFDWYIWVLTYVCFDFMSYLVHFLGHNVRVLWCIHGVHHTPKEMNLTVFARLSFFEFFYNIHTVLWLPLLGIHPLVIFSSEAISRVYGAYTHASEKFVGNHKWLDKLLITPSVHRVHHARNYIYLDRNYGIVFSIWDRLFKTYQSKLSDEEIEYGILNKKSNSGNIWNVQFLLWRELWSDIISAPRLSDKIKYIFYAPGWSHLDGGKTIKYYRDAGWKQRNKIAKR